MTLSKPNVSAATLTRSRVQVAPSGMCVTCLDGCTGLCEVGKSAVKGREFWQSNCWGGQRLSCRFFLL